METWKAIAGYAGYYEISNLGNVRALQRIVIRNGLPVTRRAKPLKAARGTDGYVFVRLSKDGKAKYWRVHRLVAFTFIPNPKNYPAVNHLDADVTNNRAENLEWCTITHNNRHTYKLGRNNNPSGSNHYAAIIDENQATAIGHLLKTDMSMVNIAKALNTTYGVVANIKKGNTWRIR